MPMNVFFQDNQLMRIILVINPPNLVELRKKDREIIFKAVYLTG